MLDQDISTADARRLLSRPALRGMPGDDRPGPGGWTRRGFLQAVGMGLGGGALVGSLGESLIPGISGATSTPTGMPASFNAATASIRLRGCGVRGSVARARAPAFPYAAWRAFCTAFGARSITIR